MSPKLYPCTVAACDRVFVRAYELRKHLAVHKDPDSVFFCPECDFITLQKKNLTIHVAAHTGDTPYHCPHTITLDDEDEIYEEPCEFKTNDPAALTKHRKKVHNYVPSSNRGRIVRAHRLLLSKRKAAKRARKAHPKSSPSPTPATEVSSTTACTTASAPDDRTLQLWKENVTELVQSMQADEALPTKVGAIRSWLESIDTFKRPTQEDAPDASKDATRPVESEDPEPSGSLDKPGDHPLDIWVETDALMQSLPEDPFASVNTPRAATPLSAPNVSATDNELPLDAFGDHARDIWAETEALVRSMSADPSAVPLPSWVTPLSAPAGCLDASAINHVARPWADADARMRSAVDSLDLFGVDYTRHPWAEPTNDAPRPRTQSSSTGVSTWATTGQASTPVASGSHATWLGPNTHVHSSLDTSGNAGGSSVFNTYLPAAHGMDLDSLFDPTRDASGNAYVPASDPASDPVNSLYDPMLYEHWMAAFEYSSFCADRNGTRLPSVVPDARTRHEACLCPDWLHEACVVDAHKEHFSF